MPIMKKYCRSDCVHDTIIKMLLRGGADFEDKAHMDFCPSIDPAAFNWLRASKCRRCGTDSKKWIA